MASAAPPPPRELKIGKIIDKTIGVVDRCIVPAVIYLAVLTIINVVLAYFIPSTAAPRQQVVGALIKFVVGIIAAYLLIEAMVRKIGVRSRTDGDAFLPYLGLSILSTLGTILGLIVVIFPGLFIMARWIIAQPLLIARGDGIRQALGESWELTKGNEFQILAGWLALLIVPIAIMIACSFLFDKADMVGVVLTQLATSAMSVISIAMGVALYALIVVARGIATPGN